MAITRGKNRENKPFYNMAEFLCDFQTDVASLPTNCGPGSTARVVENGNFYILNNQFQWVLQPKTAGSSGGGDTPGNGDTIIYDGGVVI